MGKDWLARIVAGLEDKPMIGVYITINGVTIYARTAVNQGAQPGSRPLHRYLVDDGQYLYHDRKDGAVALAKILLDTIKEQRPPPEESK